MALVQDSTPVINHINQNMNFNYACCTFVRPEAYPPYDYRSGYSTYAANMFLTYSQVGDIRLPDLVCQLISNVHHRVNKKDFMITSFVATREFHKDEGKHFHVLLSLNPRIYTQDLWFFDVYNIHPNIQNVRSVERVESYILKTQKYNLEKRVYPDIDSYFSSRDFLSFRDLVLPHLKE
jgi:hypothetical protein